MLKSRVRKRNFKCNLPTKIGQDRWWLYSDKKCFFGLGDFLTVSEQTEIPQSCMEDQQNCKEGPSSCKDGPPSCTEDPPSCMEAP